MENYEVGIKQKIIVPETSLRIVFWIDISNRSYRFDIDRFIKMRFWQNIYRFSILVVDNKSLLLIDFPHFIYIYTHENFVCFIFVHT